MGTSADECGLYYCFSIKKYLRSSCLNLRPLRSFYHFDTSPPQRGEGVKGGVKRSILYLIRHRSIYSSAIEVYIRSWLKYIFIGHRSISSIFC